MSTGARANTATRAVVAERRRQAVELRHAGTDAVTIGRQLHYGRWSQMPPKGEPVPAGWDYGEQLSTDRQLALAVHQDVERAFADRKAGLSEAVDARREAMRARLERLRSVAWSRALGGSAKHITEARKIDDQLAKLDGLYAAVRVDVPGVPEAAAVVEGIVGDLLELVRSSAPTTPAGVVALAREG